MNKQISRVWLGSTLLLVAVTGCNGLSFDLASLFGVDDVTDIVSDPTNNIDEVTTPSLTQSEWDAFSTALSSCQSLTNGSTCATSVTGFEIESGRTLPEEVTFGDCPEVTLSLNPSDAESFIATADFGNGCAVYGNASQYCSGLANATFDATDPAFSIDFESFGCDGRSISGNADVAYEISGDATSVSGAWTLTYEDASNDITTDGDSTISYDSDYMTTLISNFDGTIGNSSETWNLTVADVVTSYAIYGNFVPADGTMTLSAGDIRTISIRFGAGSPTAGTIEVSIDGSEYVETTIDELEAAIEG